MHEIDRWHEKEIDRGIDVQSPDDTMELWDRGIWFSDSQHGWVKWCLAMQRTTDGGHTWESLPAPGIRGIVRFISPSTGLVTGDDYSELYPVPLRRTDDGGLTWHTVSLLPTGTNFVWANADATRLWAVGQAGLIALSTDGGATWITVASPTAVALHDVRFADDRHGWAAGEDGVTLHTTDGGWHWSLVDTGATTDVTGLATTSANHAWIYAGGLRLTVDGGASWQRLPHVTGDANSLSMASSTTGWAATGQELLKTANAGASWTRQIGTAGAVAVDSVDAEHAWALSATQLQRTVDGVTWQTIALPGVRRSA